MLWAKHHAAEFVPVNCASINTRCKRVVGNLWKYLVTKDDVPDLAIVLVGPVAVTGLFLSYGSRLPLRVEKSSP